jgi:hypothetical protein
METSIRATRKTTGEAKDKDSAEIKYKRTSVKGYRKEHIHWVTGRSQKKKTDL